MPPKRGAGAAKLKLSDASVKILRDWLFAAENWDHPYPTQEEKQSLLARTGITPKQLTNWLTNARKRLWMPLRKKQGKAITNYAEAKRVKRFEEWDKMTRSTTGDAAATQQHHVHVHPIAAHPVGSRVSSAAAASTGGGGGGDMAILAQAAAAAAKGAPISTVLAPFNVVPRFTAAESLYPGAGQSGSSSATTSAAEGSRRSRRAKRSFSETDWRDDATSPSGNALSSAADSEITAITNSSDPVAARIWQRARDSASLADAVAEEAAASTQVGLVGGSTMPGGHGGSSTVVERGIITRLRADIEAQQAALKRHQELIDSRKEALQRALRLANMTPTPAGTASAPQSATAPSAVPVSATHTNSRGVSSQQADHAQGQSSTHDERLQPSTMPTSSSSILVTRPATSSYGGAAAAAGGGIMYPTRPQLYIHAGAVPPPPLPTPRVLPTAAYSTGPGHQQQLTVPTLHTHMRSGSLTVFDEGLTQMEPHQPQPAYGIASGGSTGQPSPALLHVDSTNDMHRYPPNTTISSSSSSSSAASASAASASASSSTSNSGGGIGARGLIPLGTGFSSGLPRIQSITGNSSPGLAATDIAGTASVQSAAQESTGPPWPNATTSSAFVTSPHVAVPYHHIDTAAGSLSEAAAASLAKMAELPFPQ